MQATFHKVVEDIQSLPLEQKEEIKELTGRMVIEERRAEISRNIAESRKLALEGKLAFTSAQDMLIKLHEDCL